MLMFSCGEWCAPAQRLDLSLSAPVVLDGPGVWAGVLSSGRCALDGTEGPVSAEAGSLLVGVSPLELTPEGGCHLLAVRITGRVAEAFAAELEGSFWAGGASAPLAAQLLARLGEELPPGEGGGLAFRLLGELAGADPAAPALPPLVSRALAAVQQNYAGLYGVEELSAQLGVTKSHLIRVFRAAMGMPPGQYLTAVRIEAAKQLLAHREYPLEVVASLCGFSGANYLCRVFRKATGLTPAAWRAVAAAPAAPEAPLPLEKELYV